MSQDSLNKTYKGYTLLEIMLSIVILGIVVLGLSLPFGQSFYLSSDDRDIVTSNNLAGLYLREVETSWQNQTEYDLGELPEITDEYTGNGRYNVTTGLEDLATNDNGQVIVRRVQVTYTNGNNQVLTDIFSDFNRPVTTIN